MPSTAPVIRTNQNNTTTAPLFAPGYLTVCILVTSLFFLWAIPNNLNDILIHQFMKSFEITRLQAGFIQSAFYMGYFLLALPSALVMRKYGYKAGIVTGLLLTGGGTFLFWPAAIIGKYGFFLFALFVMASGLAFLETAANTFIALSGAPETSERRLNVSQAFNPIGSIVAVLIGTKFILSGVELAPANVAALKESGGYASYLESETLRVVAPYVVIGVIACLLAAIIGRLRFPVFQSDGDAGSSGGIHLGRLLSNKHLVFAIVAQFFYVGAQVGTWSYFMQYVQEFTGQNEKMAGYLLTGTLGMFGLGRFSAAAIMKFIQPARLMGIYCAINITLVALAILHPGWIGMWGIFLTSFFMSLMYPTIFALGLHGLGEDSKVGASLLVMAIVGGAVLTPLMGVIGDATHSIRLVFAIPLLAYVIIGGYAIFGQRAEVAAG